ncbi:MAG: alanine--tRNA ligase [Nanoarchaeota archaeon]|nr:alanine--tRNA ligase [Nanoarchaeota archaeon]MBU1632199.1 alanine--tRNA ligase [Nanoarchaeota archaeon]MBU1875580.1 alanine--tRNA ligase [Nanoarchaeota archaeon]
MKAKELKKKYLEFFKSKGHAVVDSAPLIPEHDPTVLFTTAGMQPMVPFFLGQEHPLGKRIVNVQKCLRTVDIDEVGDPVHHTYFEMMGNWSFGDYFKKEAIEFSFEFLTKVLKLPLSHLAVTCFEGNKDSPKDEESAKTWLNLGIPKERIAFLGKKDNWWGPAGETGPCGPNTEMYYWSGRNKPPKRFDPEDNTWVELGNDVLIEFEKTKEGYFKPLKKRSIDFGGGVERTLAVLNCLDDNYQTELFLPVIKEIEKVTKKKYEDNKKSMRIIADHLRASVFILGDERGVVPSNLDQGYILRRFIRRSIRHLRSLGLDILKEDYTVIFAELIIKMYKDDYPLLEEKKEFIIEELRKEERKFEKTLEKGLNKFENMCSDKLIDGKEAFLLFQSYGFPIEMTEELAKEKGVKIDMKGFEKEYKKHQELSRVGAEKKFKGGLSDASVETTKLHTATHLLNEALRRVLKKNIAQKGSNITSERLRFDFNFDRKLTSEEIKEIEDEVNNVIKKCLTVKREELSLKEALKRGAHGEFGTKYPEKVSVYTIVDENSKEEYSKEICMGPHVKNTKELGVFKIKKEESISAGTRRIKAVLE